MSSGAPDWWLKGKLIELIEEVELVDVIALISLISRISLIDRITLIDTITAISEITTINTITNIGDNVSPRPLTSRQRTGRSFLFDGFDDYYAVITEKWLQGAGTIALTTDYSKTGASCMKITTGTAHNDVATAIIYVGLFPVGKFGIELDFMCKEAVSKVDSVAFEVAYFDGTNVKIARVKWLGEANKKWQYSDSSLVYHDIPSGAQDLYMEATLQPFFHHFKFVIDFENDLHDKLICNDQEFDLSGISIYSDGSGNAPALKFECTITNASATATRNLYVDNVLLTDQEP